MIRILARMLPAQQKNPFSTIPQFEVGEKIRRKNKMKERLGLGV